MQSDSNSTNSVQEYISREDEDEAEYLHKLRPQEPYGEILTDEDVKSYALQDFNEFGRGL